MPVLAAVVRALNDLPEPAAGLRDVDPVRVRQRTLHVVNLPPGKERSADIPFVALAVRGQDECALARTGEDSNAAHLLLPSDWSADTGERHDSTELTPQRDQLPEPGVAQVQPSPEKGANNHGEQDRKRAFADADVGRNGAAKISRQQDRAKDS